MQMIDDAHMTFLHHLQRTRTRRPGAPRRIARALAAVPALMLAAGGASATERWQLNVWEPPFRYDHQPKAVQYQPLDKAAHNWRLCVSYPHLKDPYWLSVNYGMVREARRLGVSFRLVEAGGYPNLTNQIQQIRKCVQQGADALIVGTVSFSGLTDELVRIAKKIPVIATVNDIDDRGIAAKVGVSWTEMGRQTGAFLARRHPGGAAPVKIALFPGPEGPEWVDFVMRGFTEGIAGSAVKIVTVRRGDTGKQIQRNLLEEVLEEHGDLDYVIGTALTAEAAIGVMRYFQGAKTPEIISFYFTHGVYRGIKRKRVLAAPTDQPVTQGRLSIEQAVRILEGKAVHKHIGPEILMISRSNVGRINPALSLAPASFAPVFSFRYEAPKAGD